MNISNIPIVIYTGLDDRRDSLIEEQLNDGTLLFHPDASTNVIQLCLLRAESEWDGSTRSFEREHGLCNGWIRQQK